MKKHVAQMTKKEKIFLLNKILSLKSVYFSSHCLKKSKERGIQEWMIKKVIASGNLIEYHRKDKFSHRVLIRGKQNFKGNNLCVVIDIFKKEVVTAYYNKCDDNHSTLDKSQYYQDLDIISTIISGRVTCIKGGKGL